MLRVATYRQDGLYLLIHLFIECLTLQRITVYFMRLAVSNLSCQHTVGI